MSTNTITSEDEEWIKIDLHIHTLDDPKDAVDYSAHQLLERARTLGFRVLAITLHDAVFNRPEVFADAAAMGILLIPAAEMRLHGADVIVLNVSAEEMAELKSFDDLRRLRAQRGDSIFTIAPHPFYMFALLAWLRERGLEHRKPSEPEWQSLRKRRELRTFPWSESYRPFPSPRTIGRSPSPISKGRAVPG